MSNIATTLTQNGTIFENNPPRYSWNQFFQYANDPTTPNLVRGVVANTGISFTNSDLSHACDVRFTLGLNLSDLLNGIFPDVGILTGAVKAGKNAAANAIRSALNQLREILNISIKAIVVSLNLDVSGVLSSAFSSYKAIVREINEKLKKIAQYIYDAAFVYYLIQDIQAIIKWIETLPAEIKKIVQSCLTNFQNSLKNFGNQIKTAVQSGQTAITQQLTGQLNQSLTAQSSQQVGLNNDFVNAVSNPLTASTAGIASAISDKVSSAQSTLSGTFDNKKANSSKP
jgi:hypothetical protein